MNVFELCASLRLDTNEYERELNDAESKTSSFGTKIGALASNIGSVLATAAAAGGAAITAAAGGLSVIVKEATSAYGEYQQLEGGVQKLYGNMGKSVEEYATLNGKSVDEVRDQWQQLENAQNTVLQNASKAYLTAGMSANEYIDTATSFSSALISSLGGDTQKAAELTDTAMKSISDNYNTFGDDIENVKNAYQGFAKQNYTMLDNLRLGYGGTKTEMERLIEDANEWGAANGAASDLTINSFADIVTAIDQIQQKTQIAGTTQREALETLEGSWNATKASWTNLITEMGKGGDLSGNINNLVSSAEAYVDNLMPVLENALQGIGQLVEQVAPIVADKLPELASTLLPRLIEAATNLIVELAGALPEIAGVIIDVIPQIFDQILSLDWISYGTQLVETLVSAFSEAFTAAENIDWSAVGTALINGIMSGIETAIGLLSEAGGFALEIVTGICSTITTNLPTLLQMGSSILQNILQGLIETLPDLLIWAGEMVNQLWDTWMQSAVEFINTGVEFLKNLIQGIAATLPELVSAAFTVVNQLLTTFLENLPSILEMGANMLKELIAGILSILPDLLASGLEIIAQLLSTIGTQLPNVLKCGVQILTKLVTGILNTIPQLVAGTITFLGKFIATIAEYLPKILAKGVEMLVNIITGIANTVPQLVDGAKSAIDSFINKWSETDWLEVGINAIKGIADGIMNGIHWVVEAAENVVSSIWDTITGEDGLDEHSPSKKLFGAGVNATLGLINGMNDKIGELENSAYNMASSIAAPVSDIGTQTTKAAQPYVIYINNSMELDGKVMATSVNRVLGAMV